MSRAPAAGSRLLSALIASAVTGLLLAAAAFPLVGGLGLTAKAGAEEFLVLPEELTTSPLAQRTRILASDGETELAVLYRENRVNAALLDVPELARKAVIATEDARFYAHNGVDYKGTLRAAVENAQAGGVSQGGSTLTQQYVKNALLQAARGDKEAQKAARELTLDRKLKEARYALAIEKELTKDEILERYLNIAYYGNGVYGMGTAASFYYSKPVQELTLGEGALLAGIVQSPSRFDPVQAMKEPAVMESLLARRDTVLGRMRDVGFIDDAAHAAAVAERGQAGPMFRIRPVASGCENPLVKAPFFCDYVRRALEDTELGAALGNTREERQDKLLAGGLTIVTTLDPKIQAAAQAAVSENVPHDDPFGAGAVVNIVEPGTGHVKAMAVNRIYSEEPLPGHSKLNLALGGSAGFQSGSTFKAFVLAEALKQGIPLSLTLNSPQTYTSKVCTNYDDRGRKVPYRPSNSGDSQSGRFNMTSATHASVNTYFVQLLERTGVPAAAAMAESLGVRQFVDGAPTGTLQRPDGGKYDGCAIVLGADNVSPLDMAGAYATFAARGLHCPPTPVIAVRDSRGQAIDLSPPRCTQVLDQAVADTVNQVLTGVIDGGSGRTGRAASIGRTAAGKTGTTNGSTSAWFIGYTPQLATAVWMGDPGAPDRDVKQMRGVRINGEYYRQVYGGTLPAAIWKDAMSAALKGVPEVPFPKPSKAATEGKDVVVPDVAGMPMDVAEAALVEAGFAVRAGGRVAAGPVPSGAAAYTSPRAGKTLTFGSTVTLFSSSGRSASGATRAPSPSAPPANFQPPTPATPQQDPAAPASRPGNSNSNSNNGRGNGRD